MRGNLHRGFESPTLRMKYKIKNKKKLSSIYELPDGMWKMFEEYDLPKPDDMYMVELDVEMEEGDPPLPDDILQYFYERAVREQEFEEAKKFKNELIERGFNIIIDDDGSVKFERKTDPEQ